MSVPKSQRVSSGSVALRFLLAVVVAGLLLLGLILTIYRQDVVNQRTLLAKEAEHVLDLQKELLANELRGVQSDLLYLADQNVLQQFLLASTTERNRLEREYANFALKKGLYDQIRFLDSAGMEIVRVNYHAGEAEKVPVGDLQSKTSRYYFREGMPMARGEVFVSPLDLNVEHGEIEKPIQPVIRFATPVYGPSEIKQGLLVLNYLGTPMLKKLREISSSFRGETMLVNPEGEYLQAPNLSHEWGWLLGHSHSFRNDFSAAWVKLQEQNSGQFRVDDDLFTFQRLSPGVRLAMQEGAPPLGEVSRDPSGLVLVSRISAEVANAHSQELLDRLMLMLAGVMVVVSLLAYYWARSTEIRRGHEIHIAASEARLRQLSSALLETQEAERRTLSRVLHDELGQLVTALRLDLGSLAKEVPSPKPNQLLERIIKETDVLLGNLHEIASRARPSVLDDLGLRDAMESYLTEYQQRTGITVDSQLLFDQERIPTKIGENAYRIAVEALSNVARHAKVGKAQLSIESVGEVLRVYIADSGAGFGVENLEGSTRLGVLGMRERAELLNGTFQLTSHPGQGTQISVELPCSGEATANDQSEEV